MTRQISRPRRARRQRFNIPEQLALAWKFCWENCCVPTHAQEFACYLKPGEIILLPADGQPAVVESVEPTPEDGPVTVKTNRGTFETPDGNQWVKLQKMDQPRQTWLTATDLENRVRAAAAELLDGRPYGSCGINGYMHSGRIMGVGPGGLLGRARDWLFKQAGRGVLRSYHPSGPQSHTCSGLRFVPADAEPAEAERRARAIDPKERSRTRFGVKHLGNAEDKPCCGPMPKRHAFYHRARGIRCVKDPEQVTCKKCLRLFADLDPRSLAEMVEKLTGAASDVSVIEIPASEGGDA